MSKTLYSASEFFCIAPEKMRAVVCTSKDNDRFVVIYDKDDEINGTFSLPLMFGDNIKDGNVNPSFLSIVKLNDKYAVIVNDYYYAFENNAKACLDKYIKLTKIETEDLENIEVESDDDWLDFVAELKALTNCVNECNPTEYTIKVVLRGMIILISVLADIINNK